jgi:FAD-dependent urate hydroxylase
MIQRAIIIGGGIGGLTAAVALRKAGMQVSVYEQAEKLARIGAGLTLWNNATYALKYLGLEDQVVRAGVVLQFSEIREQDGKRIARNETGKYQEKMGAPALGIHRADLQDIFLAALLSEGVCLRKKLLRIEQDLHQVTAFFEDGSQDEAELLIGADGIHSRVREQLFPNIPLRYAGYTAWRGIAPVSAGVPQAGLAPGTAYECWGQGARFGMLWVNPREVYWFATKNKKAGLMDEPDPQKALLLKDFGSWQAPIEELISLTPADQILHNDILDIPPFLPWKQGRVVLLGDAAHATTPNMGQGACQAIESGIVLAEQIRKAPDLEEALVGYESIRFPRTKWINQMSWQIGQVGQIQSPVLGRLRNSGLRMVAFLENGTLEKAVHYKITGQDFLDR